MGNFWHESFGSRITYVDRPETCTMAGSHVLVEALDGVRARELTELLVHVVGARARVVPDPDTEVLDLERLPLLDLLLSSGRTSIRSPLGDPIMWKERTRLMPTISPVAFFDFLQLPATKISPTS